MISCLRDRGWQDTERSSILTHSSRCAKTHLFSSLNVPRDILKGWNRWRSCYVCPDQSHGPIPIQGTVGAGVPLRCRTPLQLEQVLYRCSNQREPCFSSRLGPEGLILLINPPTKSHKRERGGMDKNGSHIGCVRVVQQRRRQPFNQHTVG